MPFEEKWSETAWNSNPDHAARLVDENIEAVRADDIDDPGKITVQIADQLEEVDLVISDITGNNANVGWELGFAYARSKPCVIIRQKETSSAPFDIYDQRRVDYSAEPTLGEAEKLKRMIIAAIEQVKSAGKRHTPERLRRDSVRVDSLPSKREALTRRAECLYLASRDFWDVGICVDFLLDDADLVAQLSPRVRQTLETGMLVRTPARSGVGADGPSARHATSARSCTNSTKTSSLAGTRFTPIPITPTSASYRLSCRRWFRRCAPCCRRFHRHSRAVGFAHRKRIDLSARAARIHYDQCRSELDRLRDRLGPTGQAD